ncbi:MAG: nucleotidyl transferase AbiEii/AbiGii toxin family protein [Myxococcales bacterium]|nr:nucleotidyl transferase AbiEii/AbiGii toxin family protein [Myxococcales bacterium]
MRKIESALRRIAADLSELGRGFALVGGFAVSVRTEPRTTRDVDVAVVVTDDQDAEQVTFALTARGYALATAIEQVAVGRLATVRLEAPSGTVVDLLFASSGIEAEVVRDAEQIAVIRGLTLPVPTVGHLIALKVLSRDDASRPQDRVDLAALFAAATPADVDAARAALELVEARGFARGKRLLDELASAERELGRK